MEWIIIIGLSIFIIVWSFMALRARKWLKMINKSNTIIFGYKGTGKDVLMQKLYNMKNGKKKISNIPYNSKFYNVESYDFKYKHFAIGNTYANFLEDKYNIQEKNNYFENSTMYISDAGLGLGNFNDSLLRKFYNDLPTYFALSRHLYNQNIILNVQDLDRLWTAIEEQQELYVRCVQVQNFIFWLRCKIVVYNNFNSAKQKLLPVKKIGLKNDNNRADIAQYKATNGTIEEVTYYIRKSKIKYDTRFYHNLIFGYPSTGVRINKVKYIETDGKEEEVKND